MRKAAALLAAGLLIPTGYDRAAPIRRPMEVRVLLTRVACQLTRSWCGPAASVAPLQASVAAGRTARR